MKKSKDKEEVKNNEESLYSKEQILKSNKFKNRIDILNVLLQDDKDYTLSDVENVLNKFMKRRV